MEPNTLKMALKQFDYNSNDSDDLERKVGRFISVFFSQQIQVMNC